MQYTKEQFDSIILRHLHYIKKDCEGWYEMRANLCGADLSEADLSEANLFGANLCGADLSEADLSEANLCGANLCGAYLSKANLSKADLCGAKLCGAYLSEANLCGAKLCGADLSKADLSEADLCGANLCGANLCGADLCKADLYEADLSEADLMRLGKILDEPITGYKKSREGNIITATIPAGAIVFCINGSKCRTNKARIIDMEGAELLHSKYNLNFEYRLFQDIDIKDFSLIYNIECASGFHFFKTREEAENY